MTDKYSDFNKDRSSSENIESNQIKTTDVNILLNRVRLDKKKTLKKNMLVSLLLVGLVSSITIFFNI
ncbi:hypothetical protein OA180_02035 [Candidatus Pelagibacter sp.]|nr:hypothetical protein [Candidatus Pelagibacter sp.]